MTDKVMNILLYEKRMTMDLVYKMKEEELKEWLINMNFRNKKASYIKRSTQ